MSDTSSAHDRKDPMGTLDNLYHRWGHVKIAGALVSGVAIGVMMLLIVADVVSRNFLGGSISGTFEIVQNYLMPLAVFPGLAYVYASGILPRMDLLITRGSQRLQGVTVHVLLVLELLVFGVLVAYTFGYALDGMERAIAFPAGGALYTLWPLLFVVPLGLAMIVIETLFVVGRNFTGEGTRLTVQTIQEQRA